MDIIKVFGTNMKTYRQSLGLSQEAFADTEPILVQSNVFIEVFPLKMFKESQMLLELKLIFSLLTIAKQEINSVIFCLVSVRRHYTYAAPRGYH